MKFNLEYYRTFFMTATFLSFTQAADHLYLTQSAVSQSVKKLEQELGCSLFIRSSHGLKLTKEGEILYVHVKKAFEELQAGEHELMKLAEFKTGEIKIGATETSLYMLLGPALNHFKSSFPNVHITFAGSTISDTCARLKSGEIEIAFLITPLPDDTYFTLTELMEIQDVFTATGQFPIDFDKVYTPEEITHYPLISVSPENSVRRYLEQWFLKHGVLFEPDYTVKSTSLAIPLLTNHLGIAILPEYFLTTELTAHDLHRIHLTVEVPPRKLYLATNPQTPVSITTRKFMELIMGFVRNLQEQEDIF